MKSQDLGRIHLPRTLYLHIGMPKTASTWLQTSIFPLLDHLRYLNCPESELFEKPKKFKTRQRIMGPVFKSSSQIWPGFGDAIFKELIGDRRMWLSDEQDLLISEEAIGRSGSRPSLLAAHLQQMKLKAFEWGFERFTIICVIRRQDHWLASHYAQISDRIPKPGQTDFVRLVQEVVSPRMSRYSFGMLLDYNTLYDHLIAVTGKENLLLLPYERLKLTPEEFLHSLLQELDTPEKKIKEICAAKLESMTNVRSEEELMTWRLRPKISVVGKLPVIRWFVNKQAQTFKVTPDISQKICDTYSEGNQILAEKANLDLERHGYF